MFNLNWEGAKKKYRFPVEFHLKQAVGALTLHTGVGTMANAQGIKNARGSIFGELRRLFQNGTHCKDEQYF